MPYAVLADIKKILSAELYDFGIEVDSEIEFAEAVIDSSLGGIYLLKFDDVSRYQSVPTAIRWITAFLAAWRLFDLQTILEGTTDATAAERWKMKAMEWLKAIKEGSSRLVLDDGTLITMPPSALIRSYPSGMRVKAPSAANDPMFTRSQVGDW